MNISETSRISAYTYAAANSQIRDSRRGEANGAGRFSALILSLSDEEKEQKTNTAGDGVKTALRQAMKDFQDEQLTGLTDEEREKIEAAVSAYLEENPGDVEGAMRLKKTLMKKYGFKGDPDQECGNVFFKTADMMTEHTDQETKPARSTLYHKLAAEKAKAAQAINA